MKKVAKICIISIATLILVLVLILTMVFTIKDVKINLLTTSPTLTNQNIMEALKNKKVLPYNQSVFFVNRKQYTESIEKEVPKIKVINLEIEFPNVLSVNCVERVPVFAVKISNSTYNYAIVDEEFKVINQSMNDAEYINFSFKELLKGENGYISEKDVNFNNLIAGEFISHNYIQDLKSFFASLKTKSTTESALLKTYSDIEVYMRHTLEADHLSIRFKTKTGYNIDMYNFMNDTDRKITILLNIVSNPVTENYIIGDNNNAEVY